MKKLLALPLLFALAGCAEFSSAIPQDEPVRIGVILPLSGQGAIWGETARNGIELARSELDPDGKKFKLFYEDSQFKAMEAVKSFHFLKNVRKVSAILGPIGSNLAQAVAPLADREKFPAIFTAVGSTEVTHDRDFIFRAWANNEIHARSIFDEAERRGFKKIAAILTIQDAMLDMFSHFEKLAAEAGIEIVAVKKILPDTRDLNTIMLKIRTAEPDAIFNLGYAGQAGYFTKKIRENGIDAPIFATTMHESPDEIAFAGKWAEGVWLGGATDPTDDFVKKYRAEFGVDPSHAAGTAYDAFYALAAALDGATDRTEVPARLRALRWDGASGTDLHFDENGDLALPVPLKEIRGGEVVPLEN